jgi:hypothetical protein
VVAAEFSPHLSGLKGNPEVLKMSSPDLMEISGRRIRRKHPLIPAKKTTTLVVEKTVYQFD